MEGEWRPCVKIRSDLEIPNIRKTQEVVNRQAICRLHRVGLFPMTSNLFCTFLVKVVHASGNNI